MHRILADVDQNRPENKVIVDICNTSVHLTFYMKCVEGRYLFKVVCKSGQSVNPIEEGVLCACG